MTVERYLVLGITTSNKTDQFMLYCWQQSMSEVREMTVSEILASVQYVVDHEGRKTAVQVEMSVWETIQQILEDIDDIADIERARREDDEVIVSSMPFIHCCAIKTAKLGFDEARFDKMLAESGNNARMFAALQPFGCQQGVGGIKNSVVGTVNGRYIIFMSQHQLTRLNRLMRPSHILGNSVSRFQVFAHDRCIIP
ncbi:hypothetical protein MNBD_CHLOROFLEXI01-12 [hydrothermal vent metagenome]|uniref:Uncharacterized protein n=1 Tax=hydrothermal vent metagenome TaxID=652676 RepID=A0A3B0VKR3_9ZZZZ